MSISLESVTNLGINVIDRTISADGIPCKGTDAMWSAIPANVWGISYEYGKAVVEQYDSTNGLPTGNVEYANISDIPYSSAFDITEDPWVPMP